MKSNIIEFNVEKFEYVKNSSDLNLDFIPSLVRRRLSSLDKAAFYTMNKCMDNDIEYVVFASEYGEVERLVKIIEQYSTSDAVSPALFSGSVHNYPVGVFLLNSKKSVPYNAISAFHNSISSGLLSCLISKYNKILFCYADKKDDNFYSFSFVINKKLIKNSPKYILKYQNNGKIFDNFEDYIKIFTKKSANLKSYLFKLERIDYE